MGDEAVVEDGKNEDKDEEEEEVDGEDGKRKVKVMQDSKMPSEAEIRDHEITHLPYRS